MILKHSFAPANNNRLAHLCGPLDAHLERIQNELGVRIIRRGADFKVEGPKANAQRTIDLLQALYERAGKAIGPEVVQMMLLGGGEAGADSPELLTRRADLKPRTPNQAHYLAAIQANDVCVGIGPAGTGKTYLAVACAVDALERSAVQRIVLTRPAVEAGERLGFLPGDLSQKVDPYLRPLYDALNELMGHERVQKALERQQIEIAPLAFMRGRTLNHAFLILDEAQNTTPEQMKMCLTRLGFGSKMVVTGDVSQVDLPRGQLSGLIDAERVLKRVAGVAICRLGSADVVRHPLVGRIVDAYDGMRTSSRSAARSAAAAVNADDDTAIPFPNLAARR
jgi:phosphate starvation-inducible protein PhoH and related proteins